MKNKTFLILPLACSCALVLMFIFLINDPVLHQILRIFAIIIGFALGYTTMHNPMFSILHRQGITIHEKEWNGIFAVIGVLLVTTIISPTMLSIVAMGIIAFNIGHLIRFTLTRDA